MFFVDLEKYKIYKDFNYNSINIVLPADVFDKSIKYTYDLMNQELNAHENQFAVGSNCFNITISNDDDIESATDEEIQLFFSTVNTISAAIFQYITTNERRATDYRLDVPEKLKVIKTNMSPLKKACNNQLKLYKMNIVINYKDLTYMMCDERKEQTDDK